MLNLTALVVLLLGAIYWEAPTPAQEWVLASAMLVIVINSVRH